VAVPLILMSILRTLGWVNGYTVPVGGMAPAVSSGDHILTERFTFMMRTPRKGDVVVFRSDGVRLLSPGIVYVKRIAAEPGDQVRFSDGQLYINGQPLDAGSVLGRTRYHVPTAAIRVAIHTNLMVPEGQYYVLGDSPLVSSDSRYYGCVPGSNIVSHVMYRHWPPGRMGRVE
jgi:signal peptidase I